jgi:hypothetical protein
MLKSRNIQCCGNTYEGDNKNRNGISVIDAENVTIFANNFDKMASPYMPAAIDLEPNFADQGVSNVLIFGNTFNGCRHGAMAHNVVKSTTCRNLSIHGNVFKDSKKTDIILRSWVNVSIAPNIHHTPASRAIEIEGCSTVNISSPTTYYTGSSSILILNCGDGVTITGASLISSAGHGIWIKNTKNPVVTGCTVRGWGTASAVYNAVFAEGDCGNANVFGNVFNDSVGGHVGVKNTASTGWKAGFNQMINVATEYDLAGVNVIS